ncbi:MAG: lysine--tRNA ligase [Clostridia bacterium]|nr:lysine--tRNA ligase [Clostridia bacterium]
MDEKVQTLSSEIDIRKEKVKKLKEQGIIPYIEKFDRTCTLKDAKTMEDGEKVSVCGRITFRRIMGKLSFFAIEDINARLQVSISRNEIDEETYAFFKTMVDTGDFVGVSGELYTTHTGEKTVRTHQFQLLSKAILPLPEKFHGLANQDQRYRERCMDLVSNEESRKVFLTRSKFLSFLRRFLEENGFLEVETPILQGAVCGASAKPFFTKHNALNKICNLRIAPEVYLKQVIAGGFDRVFEVAKCFRNEGMDPSHLQEFTMVEWYASYWNFEDNIKFFTKFIREAVKETNDGNLVLKFKDYELDFSKDFERINYTERVNEILGFNILDYTDVNELKEKVAQTNLFNMDEFEQCKTVGGVIDLVYKRKIRENIVQPTILYNYPACLVPLARRNDKDVRLIDMFQVLVCGDEICKAYSELVDPIVQREALEEQANARKQGDDEAMELDEDFLTAMEHGMPPISGLGFGVDRLMCLLTNQESVRDVVLFPLMK